MNVQVMRLRSKFFRPCVLPASIVLVSCFVAASTKAFAQTGAQTTTVTISNSVEIEGIDRPGINLGGDANYGPTQIFKSLNYANGGYFPGTYAGTTYVCSAGGSNTTTSWYNNITNAPGFPANFWAGATFVAIDSATGTSYGSGTVTASTANTGAAGISFTLSPAITSACNPSQNDVLIVRQTASNTLLSPSQVISDGSSVCSGATWDASDTSPSSTNTYHSLEMPSGCAATFYMDAVLRNATNTSSALAAQGVPWINLNGSYTATFKAKCLISGCSVTYSLARIGGGTTYVGSTTVNPSYSATPGVGWTSYTNSFTAAETGAQNSNLGYLITCTGTCLLQDVDVIEGSALSGNTTVFRDAVVYELEKIHPGSLRYMDATQWCSDVADEIAATGNRRWCGSSNYLPGLNGPPIGYNDVLALANLIGSDALISVGILNEPSDWTTLINWLSSSGWISTYAATGHHIYLEDGNEAWNGGASASLTYGDGLSYGYTLGLNLAAAKAASGYNSGVIKLVGDGWVAPSQGYGPYGWIANTMQAAGCTLSAQADCPNFIDNAPYMLNYLGNFNTSGSDVATTGAPFLDEWAELANIDSVTSPPEYSQSMYLDQQYAKTNYGVNTLVYEVNESTTSGIAATQLQLDQIDSSVGNALAMAQHVLLMQRDSQVAGPIHIFTLAQPYFGYNCSGNGCVSGTETPLWGASLLMATGPGQTPGAANVDRPLAIALGIINNSIGSNINLMSITQSGAPVFSYSGGQPQGSSDTVLANSTVPYVNCFSYNNGASAWTTICFNNNLTTAEPIILAGPGAPTGTVSETVFPGPSNLITDHNEDTYLGSSSIPPVVAAPSATTASGTSYSIPPASMIALTYNVGAAPPTLTAPIFSPGAGAYLGAQTVAVTFPSGSTGCIGINTLPTAPVPGTCGSGGTTYAGPITVSTSETVNAIATRAGSINSAAATATFTITLPPAAAPTFSPAAGSYTASQSVVLSDATAGATIYYTTNGTTPTTGSTLYTGAITVSASETLEAIAVEAGYSNSPVTTAAYVISLSAPPGSLIANGTYTITNKNNGLVVDVPGGSTTPGTDIDQSASSGAASQRWQLTNLGNNYVELVNVNSGLALEVQGSSGANGASIDQSSYSGGANQIWQVVSEAGGFYQLVNENSGLALDVPGWSGSPGALLDQWSVNGGANQVWSLVSTVPTATAPVFSVGGGNYTGAQSVVLSDATAGATIYYTTNGTTPTTGSTLYTGAITVSASETLEAIAVEAGYSNSPVTTAAYVISLSAPPGSLIANGTYTITNKNNGLVVDVPGGSTAPGTDIDQSASTGAASQRWQLTNLGNNYVELVNVNSGLALEVQGSSGANGASIDQSSYSGGANQIWQVVSEAGGFYQLVNENSGLALDVPGWSGSPGALLDQWSVNGGANQVWSLVSTVPTATAPVFSVGGGNYTGAQSVVLSDATAGATIYYTTNGTTPTTGSTLYTGAITVSASETLEAIAVEAGYSNSPVTTAAYVISLSAPPGSLIANGTYTITNKNNGLVVDVPGGSTAPGTDIDQSASTGAASQRWQLTNLGNNYVELVNVNSGLALEVQGSSGANGASIDQSSYSGGANQIWQVVSEAGGFYQLVNENSGLALDVPGWSGSPGALLDQWSVNGGANQVWSLVSTVPTATAPVFSVGGGNYTGAQSVVLSDATAGATIYYTTNGTTPTTGSTLYTGAITVSASETLEAIAVEAGYSNSPVTTAAYVISLSAPPGSLIANGTYTITNKNNGLVVDVPGGSTAPGTDIDQSASTGAASQRWQLTNLGNNYVELVNVNSGLALEVQGSSGANGASIDQSSYSGGASQIWQVVSEYGGLYALVNQYSGLALDVPGWSGSAGTLLDQWSVNGGANQVWSIE
jgi:hypothetical protein